jgi:hypothetical protein
MKCCAQVLGSNQGTSQELRLSTGFQPGYLTSTALKYWVPTRVPHKYCAWVLVQSFARWTRTHTFSTLKYYPSVPSLKCHYATGRIHAWTTIMPLAEYTYEQCIHPHLPWPWCLARRVLLSWHACMACPPFWLNVLSWTWQISMWTTSTSQHISDMLVILVNVEPVLANMLVTCKSC